LLIFYHHTNSSLWSTHRLYNKCLNKPIQNAPRPYTTVNKTTTNGCIYIQKDNGFILGIPFEASQYNLLKLDFDGSERHENFTEDMKDEEEVSEANLNLAVARIARNRQPPFILQHTQSTGRNEDEASFLGIPSDYNTTYQDEIQLPTYKNKVAFIWLLSTGMIITVIMIANLIISLGGRGGVVATQHQTIESIQRSDKSYANRTYPPKKYYSDREVAKKADMNSTILSTQPHNLANSSYTNVLSSSIQSSNEENSQEKNTKKVGKEDIAYNEEAPNKDVTHTFPNHVLSSYTYSNYPFLMAKFSQYHLAHEGPFTSKADRLTNSLDRAQAALDFSNEARAYERVVSALENGAFDGRTVVLDGDSLTRQFFISLGCLAWSAGYVIEYDVPMDIYGGRLNSVLKNGQYDASSKIFSQGFIKLKGGGKMYYISHPSEKKIEQLSDRMIHDACDNNTNTTKKYEYNARYNFDEDFLKLKANDVVVYGAGHHQARSKYISTYKKFSQCMQDAKYKSSFNRWPHFMYQLGSVESFWTKSGNNGDERIDGGDNMSCQSSVKISSHREEERVELGGLMPFIGDTIDVKNLGELHVWHGDCLHWQQPGVPDLYAGELADFLLSSSSV